MLPADWVNECRFLGDSRDGSLGDSAGSGFRELPLAVTSCSREAAGRNRGFRSSLPLVIRASLDGLGRREVGRGTGSFEKRGMPVGLVLWRFPSMFSTAVKKQTVLQEPGVARKFSGML